MGTFGVNPGQFFFSCKLLKLMGTFGVNPGQLVLVQAADLSDEHFWSQPRSVFCLVQVADLIDGHFWSQPRAVFCLVQVADLWSQPQSVCSRASS